MVLGFPTNDQSIDTIWQEVLMGKRTRLMEGAKRALWKKDLWVTYPSVVAGGLIWSLAINGILIHHQFMSGGVSGFALVIHYLFRFLPVGMMVFLMNIPIFAVGWAMISGRFFILSLMGMLSFSFFLTVTTWLHIPIDNPLLAALFAGVISGVGSGLVFRSGASGGGTGIIAMVLNRHFSIRVGMVFFALNSIPLILGGLLINLEAALYSIVYIYVSSSVTDRILTGFNERRSVFIMSTKSSEIADEVLNKLHRGVTFFKGEGAYTHTAMEVAYCVVPLFELARLKDLIRSIDPKAFVVINETMEVIGKGFEPMGKFPV
jgi:uncharacterized membrane-anchored protein YitT (DUF2179 family)